MGQYYVIAEVESDGVTPVSYMKPVGGLKMMEHGGLDSPTVMRMNACLLDRPRRIVWCGDYSPLKCGDVSVYDAARDTPEMPAGGGLAARYVVNHTRKLFVDRATYGDKFDDFDSVDPLVVLTSSGCGLGNGDYTGAHLDLVGGWCGDMVSVSHDEPEGMTRIEVVFR